MTEIPQIICQLHRDQQNKVTLIFNEEFVKLDDVYKKHLLDWSADRLRSVSERINLPTVDLTKKETVLSMSVLALCAPGSESLSNRTLNILGNENIKSVEDLIKLGSQHMLRIPNCGRKSVNELKAALAVYGLEF